MKRFGFLFLMTLLLGSCVPEDGMAQSTDSELNQSLEEVNSSIIYDLTEEQRNDLTYMWQEEKVARDVYITLGQAYPRARVFQNIQESEQSHMEAVSSLLQKYEIPVPGSEQVGVFTDPVFQALYNDLVAQGMVSSQAAFQVGVDIETLDIDDIGIRIDRAAPDAQEVFTNLLNGSYNHLAAFERQL